MRTRPCIIIFCDELHYVTSMLPAEITEHDDGTWSGTLGEEDMLTPTEAWAVDDIIDATIDAIQARSGAVEITGPGGDA